MAATPHQFPLRGLRVINFGWVWAAPVLGHTFGDMGAEVIKVETQRRPDLIRQLPHTYNNTPNESLYSHSIFRDQLGITLDMATAQGAALARELVVTADVVVENFSPGVMGRYGLDYASLRRLRPDVVMISLSAAGQSGPQANIATYGSIIASLAGLHALQGYAGAEKPSRYGTSMTDPVVGMMGAFAVLAALRHRNRTGKGQYIDLSQWEGSATLLGGPMMDFLFNGRTQAPRGNRDEAMAPHGCYPSKGDDRWVTIAVESEAQWQALCQEMGQPELARDARFATLLGRHQRHDALDGIIGAWTSSMTNMEATRILQARGIAAFPSLSDVELYEDPHFKERGDWVEVQHRLGPEWIYGMPWKLSETPGGVQRAAPVMGQDNSYVFRELLGLADDQVARLEREQVLY